MQISIKIDPAIDDMATAAGLVNQLTAMAEQVDNDKARSIRNLILYRLKRMRVVESVDSGTKSVIA